MKLINLTGLRYGRLTVIERDENKGKIAAWRCICDCGNETIVRGDHLRSGVSQSCGCLRDEMFTKDMTGQRFGRLIAIKRTKNDYLGASWLCRCDCGNESIVRGDSLRNGHTKSCGCLLGEALSKRFTRNLAGKRFGRLQAIKKAKRVNGRTAWLCSCDCGKQVVVLTTSLTTGNTKSCGCLADEMVGEKASNWRGGIQYTPYTQDFNDDFKEQIRKRDGYKCRVCGKSQSRNGRLLDVHHIDYDKRNSTSMNCISLCRSCHAKTNRNRQAWTSNLTFGNTKWCNYE